MKDSSPGLDARLQEWKSNVLPAPFPDLSGCIEPWNQMPSAYWRVMEKALEATTWWCSLTPSAKETRGIRELG